MSDSILSFQVSLNTFSKKETDIFMLLCGTFFMMIIKLLCYYKSPRKKVAMNGLKSKLVNLPQSGTILNVIERSTYTKRKHSWLYTYF